MRAGSVSVAQATYVSDIDSHFLFSTSSRQFPTFKVEHSSVLAIKIFDLVR